MNKGNIPICLIILLILLIPLSIYTLNFRLLLFDSDFYSSEFEKHGVYTELGKEVTDSVNSEVLGYFNGGSLETEFFDAREKSHLADVKSVLSNVSITSLTSSILLVILLSFMIYSGMKKQISFTLIGGGAFTILAGILVLISSMINFNIPFTLIHRMFFDEGTWLFSAGSNIITLYPEGVFYDFAVKLFTNSMLQGLVVSVLGLVLFISVLGAKTEKRKVFKTAKKRNK